MISTEFQDFLRTTGALRVAAVGAVIAGLYSLIPIWKETSVFHQIADHSSDVYSGIEILLGLLLVLRSNTAYQRWWEGRILWGKLVNVSRNLVIKADALVDVPESEIEQLSLYVGRFAEELASQLRGRQADDRHLPSDRVREIYGLLNQWRRRDLVSDDLLRVLDSEAREFLEICGGCERIQKTPLSPSYRVFIWHGIALILLTLPWSLASEMGVWSIPLTMIHAYFFVGLQVLARSAEDPFGTDADDLDLDSIVTVIKKTACSRPNKRPPEVPS